MGIYENRIAVVQAEMGEKGVDFLMLAPTANMYYLTGIGTSPDERLQVFLLPQKGEPCFVLPEMYRNLVENAAEKWKLITWADGEDPAAPFETLLQGAGVIAVDEQMWAQQLMQITPKAKGAKLTGAAELVGAGRVHKDQEEIARMKAAGEIVDAVLPEAVGYLREGITEKEMAWVLERLCREKGAEAISFSPIVGYGPNGANPHHRPSDTPLTPNTFIVMDFGARLNHYCSDMTRTVCFGKADEEMRRVYETVLAANRMGFATARPGVSCEEVDRAVRGVIEQAGYGPYFTHRTGHGLGLDVHEDVYIVEGNSRVLEPGMSFSIEPGIYLPGRFGVRIEDIAAVTENGVISLNECTRDLEKLTKPS